MRRKPLRQQTRSWKPIQAGGFSVAWLRVGPSNARYKDNQEEQRNEKDFDSCPHGRDGDPRRVWTGSQDPKGMPARKDQPGRRVRRACKACPALKGNRALKGHRVPKGHKDRRVRPAQRAIPDPQPLPSGRFRPTARSAAMQMKTWCRCSVRPAVHPMAPSAAAVRQLVFVSKSSRHTALRSNG
jgi:hypothetical protein